MSRPIKVSDDVYERIRRLQGPRETYSQVIERCIEVVETIKGLRSTLSPADQLMERPKEEVKSHELP